MKPTPLHLIVARLRKMRLEEQISRLRVMVALERLYSVRRNELQSILDGKLERQLRRCAESQPSITAMENQA